MDSRAAKSKTKNNARPLTRLSVAKKDGQKNTSNQKGSTSNKQKGLSITSFFKNIPPPKLACPLCGKLVQRFKINEHIDCQCQEFLEENDPEAPGGSHGKQEKTDCKLPNDAHNRPDEKDAHTRGKKEAEKTSPYFKKNCTATPESLKTNSQTKVIKTVSLGSLSSKLSRRALKFSETSKTDSASETDLSMPSSSQKENCDENVAVKTEQVTDLAPTFTLQETTANQLRNPKMCDTPPPKGGLQDTKAPQSGTRSSLRSTKRKKDESPSTSAPSNVKKGRYMGNDAFPIFSQSGSSCVDASQSDGSRTSSSELKVSKFQHSAMEGNQIVTGKNQDFPQKTSEGKVDDAGVSRRQYYLQNFLTVLDTVMENKDDKMLFDEDDLSYIDRFKQLSVPGQMLYVRLFQRKLKWLQVSKLDYTEISSDLKPVVQELICAAFLQSESELKDIQEVLDLLPGPELRSLAKTFHLRGQGNNSQKQQLVDGLLRLTKLRSLFALIPGQNNTAAVILKRAKQLAGSCVRLSRGPRVVFSRVFLLFSLKDALDEDDMAAGGQGQLYTILLVNSGRLAFPAYTVQRSAQVFRDRDDLIRYEAAMRSLQEVITAMLAGCWEEALGLYTAAKHTWQDLQENCDLSCQEELPVFLRCFTVGWTYTRILSRGVEILQRLRHYEDAVEQLRSLLSQSVFCVDSRGRWWDRLALNLQQHLKQHEQAIYAIRDGLKDPLVRTGHRLSLYQRAARMKESASFKKYRLLLRKLPSLHVQDVTHVTIRGQLFPHEGGMGKSVFLRPAAGAEGSGDAGDATVICSVEDLALAHYRELGFDQGIHGEGSTFSTLFGLLMWDIVFMEGIADVFRTPYQTCPLDLHTDSFYNTRREAIETRVELLREASTETLQKLLADVWSSQEGKVCTLVNWERFSSLQQAQSLVACMGGSFLSGVVLRMAKDYRHSRGGLPDLVVWNKSNNSYKLVEVKGPNDRLSQKQQLWLEELQNLGADVEVCHVKATGARSGRLE